MNDFMELRKVITTIVRRWWLLAALTVIGAMLGYVISRAQTPVYQASTTVLVGESIRSSRVDRVDIQISEALIQTYVEIARRQPIMQGVVTTLNLNETWQNLSKRVTVTNIESTQLIEISVEANSPEQAEMIADEIVNQLILLSPSSLESTDNQQTSSFNREQITNLQERIVNGQARLAEIDTAINNSISEVELTALQQEKATLEGLIIEWERNYTQLLTLTEPKRDPTQLSVVEPAHSSNRMVRPRIQLNSILGGAVGMVLALGLIFLLDFLDDTYKSLKDFSQSEEVNVLGSIRTIKGKKLSDKLIAHLQPHSPITESYRIIRSRIRFKKADHLARSIMVTSSMPEEGKSITAANLAVVFAQANFKTVIVDADLRHPILHQMFDVQNEAGLGDLLSSRELKIEDCLRNTSVSNLRILTSGEPLPDPSGQLGSERMEEIIRDLKESAQIVIFDTPPVLVFADAIALSRRIDGSILVIRAGKSTRSAVNQTLIDLQNANANLLGSIFDQSPKSDSFSVNKVYMQERPQLPFVRALVKKDDQFSDLRGSAMPLTMPSNEDPGLPKSDPEKVVAFNKPQDEPGDLAISEGVNLEITSSNNGAHAAKMNVPFDTESIKSTNHKKPSPFQDVIDSPVSRNENLEASGLDIAETSASEMQIHDLQNVTIPLREAPEMSDLESVQTSVDEQVHDPADATITLDETPEVSLLESEYEQASVDPVQIHELNDTDPSVIEDAGMSDLEGEQASNDETQFDDQDDSATTAVAPQELSSSDTEAQVNEADVQQKKKRNRRAKRRELKGEAVSMGSPNDPIDQINE
jgi:capsular exopolysaccharide synthesis family protein